MSIKRYIADKDNTITSAFKFDLSSRATKANMGSSDIVETFAIYGQANSSSLEKSRVLVRFPINDVLADRNSSAIPDSGSVRFKLVLSNAQHGQTTPEKFYLTTIPMIRDWEEGYGLDMESYLDAGASNWLSASSGSVWYSEGGDYRDSEVSVFGAVPSGYVQYFEKGPEDTNIDVTSIVEEWLKYAKGNYQYATASILFPSDISSFSGSTLTFHTHEGQKGTFKFIGNESTASSGTGQSTIYKVPTGSAGTAAVLMQNLYNVLTASFGEKVSGSLSTSTRLMTLTQSVPGFFGNTVITSSVHATCSVSFASALTNGDKMEIVTPSSTLVSFTASAGAGDYNFVASSAANAATNLYNLVNANTTLNSIMTATNPSSGNLILKMKNIGTGSTTAAFINGGSTSANALTINGTANGNNASISAAKFRFPTLYSVLSSSFTGGVGAPNHGFMAKLTDSYEGGSLKRSFYTKKFFARSSQYFFKRPFIQAEWDLSIKDDRGEIYKSSSLAPSNDNINSIYLYNRQRHGLVDLPKTGSYLLVSLMTSSTGGTAENLKPEGGVSAGSLQYITASRVSKGVYRADFSYDGSKETLYDMWYRRSGNTTTPLGVTGSALTVKTISHDFYYSNPVYSTKIINLKPSYNNSENVTFRIFTRDKNWQPNLYTKASNKVPVSNIKNAYFRLKRVADNFMVIPYSTGSTPSYSSLSYDISGSFFDLDMSLLESGYTYEVSFLHKYGNDYVEQKEKFKFRVDS